MVCTLERFLRTGNLGKIKLYSSLNEVQDILGETNEIFEAQANIFILKYDYLQLTFQENIIRKINIAIPSPEYNKESSSCLEKVLDEPWIFTTEISLERFINILQDYDPILFWEIDTNSSIGTQLCLIIERKVKIYFDLDRFEFVELHIGGDIYYSTPI